MITCKICGKKVKKTLVPHLKVHGLSLEDYLKVYPDAEEYGKEFYIERGKQCGENAKKLGIGIHALTRKELSEAGKKGGTKCTKLKHGFHKLSYEEKVENCRNITKIREERRKTDPEFNDFMKNIRLKSVEKAHKTIQTKRLEDPEYDKYYCSYHVKSAEASNEAQKKNPEKWERHHKNLGKIAHKKHPNLSKDNWIKMSNSRPNIFSEAGKNGIKSRKKNPNFHKECSRAGLKSILIQRENKPYYFMDVPFDSSGEREVGKHLHTTISLLLIEGDTCHFKVDGGEIDFRIPKELVDEYYDVFLEYHPCETFYEIQKFEDYFNKRRQLLDKNGFSKNKLIVIQKLSELDFFLKTKKKGSHVIFDLTS